jgi:hypothetical protein
MWETAIPRGQRCPKELKLIATAHQWLVVPCNVAVIPCLLDCECRIFPDTECHGFCVLIIHWWWTVRRNLAVHRRWVHNNGRWVDSKNFIDTVDIPVIIMHTSVNQAVIAIQVTELHIVLFRIQFRKRILINIYTLLLVTVINVIIFIIFCTILLYVYNVMLLHICL